MKLKRHAINRLLVRSWCIVVLLLPWTGCRKPPRPAGDDRLAVKVQIVEKVARPRSKTLTGEFRSRIQSNLSFRVGGRIESRSVDVGDRVATGDILASLDKSQLVSDVGSARAALESAEASKQKAMSESDRTERLIESNAASRADFDDAKAALLTAEGLVEVRQADLEAAERQLQFTDIVAQSPGVIIDRQAEVGQVVGAAQPVFTVADDGDREAVFDVFPSHIPERPIDDEIALTLLSDPSVKTVGIIREIAPSIDRTTGTVRVKVAVPDPPPQMQLGAPVVGEAKYPPMDVVELPWTALMREGDQTSVWVVDPETEAVARRVLEVESYVSGVLLVTGGLKPGEIVVVAGAQLLRPGQKVKPIATKTLSAGEST
ncbi:efflux RND transporter periplasmic adaptor subunit [Rubripirellula reticaptiva]|uniref:Efflux pump periplasmic linker BepF n=1 Tax=Rubripirellula reticaptiva TaxID=2528013 RepID=A0A5C6ELN8_9BACT|nr:efflux RND transporter periplasmic adaptor subunit [Rubripirellula reticaptiva]TWU48199.1 Efflux pump periplasmic linker BepF [Rubripirellula reticaptiva]